jgi:hypothetical protein
MKPRYDMTLQELHDADDIVDVYSHLTEDLWESFWSKVNVRGKDECWPYIGGARAQKKGKSLNQFGYGLFWYGKSKEQGGNIAAHKLAYIFGEEHTFEEPLNKSEVILHKCKTRSSDRKRDLRSCCNPRHLKRGTTKENILDMIEAGTWRPWGRTALIAKRGG